LLQGVDTRRRGLWRPYNPETGTAQMPRELIDAMPHACGEDLMRVYGACSALADILSELDLW
jgi:hypothetical protein